MIHQNKDCTMIRKHGGVSVRSTRIFYRPKSRGSLKQKASKFTDKATIGYVNPLNILNQSGSGVVT